MPYSIRLPDGTLVENIPDDLSPEEAKRRILRARPDLAPPPKEGLGAALRGGAERLLSTAQTGIESLFDAEGAARRGVERGEDIGRRFAPGADLEAVKKAYQERGLLPAAGEVISQIPGAVAEQLPNIGATLASARLGAMAGAPFGPLGALVGGVGGAAAPSVLQLFGAGLERQAEEGADISRGRALAAAVPGAALETAATFIPLGRTVIGKVLGPRAAEALKAGQREGVERLAKESLGGVLARGAGVGALAEIPTEVAQQMLERAQAGLDITSDDALAEYGQAAYGAGLVGTPFGAVGRVGQRSIARGEVQAEEQKQRAEEERVAAQEAAKKKAEEDARKLTPEYRQELNAQIVDAQDQLRGLEAQLKDKTLSKEEKEPIKQQAGELRKKVTDLNRQMEESIKAAGLETPAELEAKRKVQAAKAAAPQTIVDDFGNVLTPKTKALTPEEEAAGLEQQAEKTLSYYAEREQLLEKLREEEQARREQADAELQESVKTFLQQADELAEQESGAAVAFARKAAELRKAGENKAAQEMALDRIKLVLDKFGLRAAGLDAKERKEVESQINEGVVDRNVSKVLGLKGLRTKTLSAAEALPNIEARIQELQDQRQKAIVGADPLMLDNGQLTKKGYDIVATEAKLNELNRLKDIAAQQKPAETATETALAPALERASASKAGAAPVLDIPRGTPSITLKGKVEEAKKQAGGAFVDLTAALDDYRQNRFLDVGAAPGQIGLASSTREGLLRNSEEARKRVVDNLINEVAYERAARGLRPFSRDEAIGFSIKVDEVLKELTTRSVALPKGQVMQEIVIDPAQVRSGKIVSGARTVIADPRPLAERQFGAPKEAVEVLAESIRQLRDQTIDAGRRPVRAERPILKQQFKTQPEESQIAQGERLVNDIERVIAGDVDPAFAEVMSRAADVIANRQANPSFLDTVDEQVGRILRGTDQANTEAALFKEIKQDLDMKAAERADTAGQADMFAEERKEFVTERATPATFQRYLKSKEVQNKRDALAKAKQLENELRAAKRDVDEEARQALVDEERSIFEEITKLADNIKRGMGDNISTLNARKFAAIDDRIKKLVADYKKRAGVKPESEVAEGERLLNKLLKEDTKSAEPFQLTSGSSSKQFTTATTQVRERLEKLQAKLKEATAALNEVVNNPKKYEQKFKRAYGRGAKKRVNKLIEAREKFVEEVKQQIETIDLLSKQTFATDAGKTTEKQKLTPAELKKAKAALARRIDATLKRMQEQSEGITRDVRNFTGGLDLPGVRVTTEFETVTAGGKDFTRRKRVVARIKSPEEIAQARKELEAEAKKRVSAGATFQDLEEQETTAVEKLRAARKELVDFRKIVGEAKAAKDFKKFEAEFYEKDKQLQAAVDQAKASVDVIRANKKMLSEFDQVERETKRNPAQRTVAGEITEGQRKFTEDQMFAMMGDRGRIAGPRTYSVDDTVDFAIGDSKPETPVDQAEAEKRLKEVKAKAKAMGVEVEYYRSIAEAPIAISRAMAKQGLDPLEDSVKGGVMPDGSVFFIVDAHSDMLDLEQTITHELVGHYSFESMLGKDGMLNLMRKIDKDFATKDVESGLENLADELGVRDQYDAAMVEAYMFHKERLKKGEMTERDVRNDAKLKGLRELIAYTMEKRVTESFYKKAQRFIKEMVGAFRAALKKLGLMDASKMSTSDLFYLMKQADSNFKAGKPMAYRNEDGTTSFSATAAIPSTGIGQIIAKPGKVFDNVKANLMGLNFRTQFVDRLAAVEALIKKGLSQGQIDSLKAMDVLYFSRMVDQLNNFVAEFSTNGVGKITKNAAGERMYTAGDGPSLKDVAQALNGSGVDSRLVEDEFTQYLVALRANRVGLDKLDYSGKITQAQVDATIARYKNNAAFNKAKDLYRQYNNNLLDLAVQAESMDPAQVAKLKDSDYVPYYRQRNGGVELVVGTEKPIRIGNFKDQPHLKELVGGEDKVLPVFTGAMQNTSLLVNMALKNMATRNTAWTLRDMGVMEIFTGDGPADANVVRFKQFETKDGKTKMVNKWARIDPELGDTLFGGIPTELVVQGMEGIKTTIPGIVRMLGLPATVLRRWVTRNPKYAVNQIFRDSMAAVMTTGADFVPVVDTLKQLSNMSKSDALRKLQGSGVVGGQVLTGDSRIDQEIIKQMTSGKGNWAGAMAKLDKFAMMGDAATRLSMYNSFLKQGLSEREAIFATLEAMNFGRRGLSPSVLYANILIPFFNAQVQGLDVLWRAWKGDMPASQRLRVKQKLQARLLMMAGFTLAYAAMMQDDETYKNANPDERYANWFVPTPVGTLRVPIPFELGLIGKAIPEGVYRAMFSDDKGGDVASALGTMLFRSVPGDLPTAIKAPVELMLNKSFFTNRPIVDARLEGLAPSEQFRPNTPEVIKLFGVLGLSPVQVEYAIKGFTGTLPVALLRLLDPVFASSEVVKPEMKLEELPIIGSFFQPEDAGGIINAAYARVGNFQRASNTYKKMLEDGREEEAERYLQENLADIDLASAGGAFRQEMGELTKEERAIRGSALSPEEKRERLKEIRKLKIALSRDFTTFSEQIKSQSGL